MKGRKPALCPYRFLDKVTLCWMTAERVVAAAGDAAGRPTS